MSLTAQPLALESSPRAASEARRWVSQTCRDMHREDLIESATLAVSELVTNAVIHAAPPIAIRIRGTRDHPRFEVLDGSTHPLVVPRDNTYSPTALVDLGDVDMDTLDLESVLTTFGRGLSLVAMASVAWGASMNTGGKIVWFEPAAEMAEVGGPEPVVEHDDAPPVRPAPVNGVPVLWFGMDPTLFLAQRRQYYGLRRELRLLALAHGDAYPLAGEMGVLFNEFEPHFPSADFTMFPDQATLDTPLVNVSLVLDHSASSVCAKMSRMFDLADDFCRSELLLSAARAPLVRAFQSWFLGEAVRQLEGHAPRRWARPAELADR